MVDKIIISPGKILEARVQRLFMCQGALAERGLFVRTTHRGSPQVTDIDIVAHDYNLNFHYSRIFAECKGGRNFSVLDRVVWVKGMMSVIGAEFAYLVIHDKGDVESKTFAKTQGVNILQRQSLEALEEALKIGDTFWPGRSNLNAYEPFDKLIQSTLGKKTNMSFCSWLYEASNIWRDSSALAFSYGRLNALLRLLSDVKGIVKITELSQDEESVLKYSVAALAVRLSQYVLFVAADTLEMTKTEREQYVTERMVAGTLGIEQSKKMLKTALALAKSKLEEQGVTPPVDWDVDHLLMPPAFSKPFSEVVTRAMHDGNRSRLLPLAMELKLFGYGGNEKGSSGLVNRIRYAVDLTGLIRAFMAQSLEAPEIFLNGPEAIKVLKVGTQTPEKKEETLFNRKDNVSQ